MLQCARMVQKYFQDKAVQAQKAEKSQELRIRKIASCIAKEIKTFWNNAHKVWLKLTYLSSSSLGRHANL
jgi:E1A-binding protein p400